MLKHRPIYNQRVKISGWEDVQLALPFDCNHGLFVAPETRAHYKNLGSDEILKPHRTTTLDLQEDIFKKIHYEVKITRTGFKRPGQKVVVPPSKNYMCRDYNIIIGEKIKSNTIDLSPAFETTFQQSYQIEPKSQKPVVVPKPNFLINRLLKSKFMYDDSGMCETKFLDDLKMCDEGPPPPKKIR